MDEKKPTFESASKRLVEIETQGRLLAELPTGNEEELERLKKEYAEMARIVRQIVSARESARRFNAKALESMPPRLGERLLLLILTKEERVNIPGDLEEEYRGIAAKHGAHYAKLWYYKQVTASAWPRMRKAVGWGVLASVGEWIRKLI